MGWCSGTDIARAWFGQIKKNPRKGEWKEATFEMISALRDMDWDCEWDFADEDSDFALLFAQYRHENGEDKED